MSFKYEHIRYFTKLLILISVFLFLVYLSSDTIQRNEIRLISFISLLMIPISLVIYRMAGILRFRNYLQVNGIIFESKIKRQMRSFISLGESSESWYAVPSYRAHLTISYEVNNEKFQIKKKSKIFTNKVLIEDKFKPGKSIQVYFNQNNPKCSALEFNVDNNLLFYISYILMVFFPFGFIFMESKRDDGTIQKSIFSQITEITDSLPYIGYSFIFLVLLAIFAGIMIFYVFKISNFSDSHASNDAQSLFSNFQFVQSLKGFIAIAQSSEISRSRKVFLLVLYGFPILVTILIGFLYLMYIIYQIIY